MTVRADTTKHTIAVNDGAEIVDTLVERAGRYQAFDRDGRLVGEFSDQLQAARALPRTKKRQQQ